MSAKPHKGGQYVGATELRFCRQGHPMVEANRYISPGGGIRCLTCKRQQQQKYVADIRSGVRTISKHSARKYAYGLHRNDEMLEAQPITVKWWHFELSQWASKLRGKAAVGYVVEAFERHHGHSPSIVLCHPANVCQYGEGDERDAEVVVRVPNPAMAEPAITSEIFFCAR